jgi:hypothetical protein
MDRGMKALRCVECAKLFTTKQRQEYQRKTERFCSRCGVQIDKNRASSYCKTCAHIRNQEKRDAAIEAREKKVSYLYIERSPKRTATLLKMFYSQEEMEVLLEAIRAD